MKTLSAFFQKPPEKILPAFFIALHFIKIAFWIRGVRLSSPYPILQYDYSLYYGRFLRAIEFLQESGRFWGYDPFQSAGALAGPLEVGAQGLGPLYFYLFSFIPPGTFFLAVQIGLLAAFPFCVLPFVRALGADRRESWICFGMSVIFFGNLLSQTKSLIYRGLFWYFVASFVLLVFVGFLIRFYQSSNQKPFFYFVLFGLLAIWVHPATAVLGVIPILWLGASLVKERNWKKIGLCLLSGILLVAGNYFWLRPFLHFKTLLYPVVHLTSKGWEGILNLIFPKNPLLFWEDLSFIHMLLLALGTLSIRLIFQRNKKIGLMVTLWSVVVFIFGFFGSVIPFLAPLQPMRFEYFFWILFSALSGIYLAKNFYPENGKPIVAVSLTALAFFLGLFTDGVWKEKLGSLSNKPNLLTSFSHGADVFKGIGSGRLLYGTTDRFSSFYFDFMMTENRVPTLGGPNPGVFTIWQKTIFNEEKPERKKGKSKAKPYFLGEPLENFTAQQFKKRLQLFNISQIATFDEKTHKILDSFEAVVSSVGTSGVYTIYQTALTPSWFLEGKGDLSMDFDRLTIDHPAPGDAVLKFHYIDTLKVRGADSVEPVHIEGAPLPFIRVVGIPEGTSRVEVYNAGLEPFWKKG